MVTSPSGGGVDFSVSQRKVDEILFQARGEQDRVDALKQGALFAVVHGTIDARKCLTRSDW